MRLDAVREATNRSRFVFLVMTIAAVTVLVSLWNSTLAWDRGFAFETVSRVANSNENNGGVSSEWRSKVSDNQSVVTREWLSKLNISVGLFGIHVGAADLAVVGSTGLIIIMVWFFFSQRRENRAVVGLLRYCRQRIEEDQFDKDRANYVYAGIVQSILFIDMGGGDEPMNLVPDKADPRTNKVIRGILKWLVFLPPLTILAIILSDCISLLTQSFARESVDPLWKELWANSGKHKLDISKIILFELFAIWSCAYTFRLCKKCRRFTDATSQAIRDFKKGSC